MKQDSFTSGKMGSVDMDMEHAAPKVAPSEPSPPPAAARMPCMARCSPGFAYKALNNTESAYKALHNGIYAKCPYF